MRFIKLPTRFYTATEEECDLVEKGLIDPTQLDQERGHEWVSLDLIERFNRYEEGTTIRFVSGKEKTYDIHIDEWLKLLETHG